MNRPFRYRIIRSLYMFSSLLMLLSGMPQRATAQCQNTGTMQVPTVVWNDGSEGDFGFGGIVGLLLNDGILASASATATLLYGKTNLLKSSGYGFNVPPSASICGIEVEVVKKASGIGIFSWINDNKVRLMKNGIVTGSNKANNTPWTTAATTTTYGGPTDLWGSTWTAADLNKPEFGLAFAAEITGLAALLPTASLDNVRMKVYYQNLVLPLRVTDFRAKKLNEREVQLNWTGSGHGGRVMVQRSLNGNTWSTIHTIPADETDSAKAYQYTDLALTGSRVLYRLGIQQPGTATTYSEVLSVQQEPDRRSVVYPNPATETANVTNKDRIATLRVYNSAGILQHVPVERISEYSQQVGLTSLTRGMYFLVVNGEVTKLMKN